MDNLLIGSKASWTNSGRENSGVIIKVDGQHDGSYLWLLMSNGDVQVKKIANVKIDKEDVNIINRFSENRTRRLKIIEKNDPITREELIDFDD